jgi:hypothetical protein
MTMLLAAFFLTPLGGGAFGADLPPPAVGPAAAGSRDPQLLNSAASLLADLLKNEKNLNKILIIKGHSKELGGLVDAISHTAADGENELKALAQGTPGMALDALNLPPGEAAARKAMAKTKEHLLLFSAGNNFAFNLLLTQTDALSYGSHLAEIVAANAPRSEAAHPFHELAKSLDRLLDQVTAQIRALPPK